MSEEVRNSSTTIPKILMWTIVINGTMAFAFLLTILFCIGNVENALNSPTGYPIIEIFQQATGSTKAAAAMESGIVIIAFCSTFATLASVSRLTWAFARDGGLPFSKFFAHVRSTRFHHLSPCSLPDCGPRLPQKLNPETNNQSLKVNPTYRVPLRSIALVISVIVLLSLINIGSSTALNAILSLSTWALYISYLIPITLLIMKRLRKEPIAYGPFTLGKFGIIINGYALIYGIFICIFLPFPPSRPVTASNMNYASPVMGAVILFALVDWFLRGRKKFVGPLREIDENDIQDDRTDEALVRI